MENKQKMLEQNSELLFKNLKQAIQVSQNRYYQIYATIISFWGPSLIMVIVYFKLWSAAKRMQRQDRLVLRWQGISPSEQLEERPVLHQHHQNGTVLRGSSVARANAHFLFALRRSAHKFRQEDKNNNSSSNGNQPRASTTTEQSNQNNLSNGRASAGSTLGAIRIPLVRSVARGIYTKSFQKRIPFTFTCCLPISVELPQATVRGQGAQDAGRDHERVHHLLGAFLHPGAGQVPALGGRCAPLAGRPGPVAGLLQQVYPFLLICSINTFAAPAC
jgi:hypothetical protein